MMLSADALHITGLFSDSEIMNIPNRFPSISYSSISHKISDEKYLSKNFVIFSLSILLNWSFDIPIGFLGESLMPNIITPPWLLEKAAIVFKYFAIDLNWKFFLNSKSCFSRWNRVPSSFGLINSLSFSFPSLFITHPRLQHFHAIENLIIWI